MSFSKESFTKKLSVLQDTQESIVSISQWVFFHHRHSKECAKIWSDYILTVPPTSSASAKKLCLLYLCNDVVQRAKRKRKQEFIDEFALILPNVIRKTYGTLDAGIRPKLDRLINVWQERSVFNNSDIQKMRDAVESVKTSGGKIDEPAQAKAGASGEIVPELKHLNELIISLNRLNDISQANLTQFGIQSKTYLPQDPSKSDKLPSPKVYISKLNMLEKLSKLSIVNIEELKSIKKQIAKQLESLSNVISEGCKTDDTKVLIINDKLNRLYSTREELQSILNEDSSASKKEDEEPSPSYDNDNADEPNADDDDDDILPTYESDDDDDDDKANNSAEEVKEEPTRKRRASQTPSGGSTPSKRVAFSEDIEVKEFDRDDSEVANVTDAIDYDNNDDGEDEFEVSSEFEQHHKDDLELKHEHDSVTDDDGGYDPSSSADVMSLLSKLA
ncbi:DUF618-domain-containing protein [Suhomyces tanzawaensis NRRL Y-17324]|uniref:DUF618-domain-containing protein n=1 Tax=Suhomyces tanzawaensis NRRL Y-17324 TaxID=984487 RepID=A0A1E4SJ50_9ASCO|nr:DUF618-domain-containing protein [Suhomyces tanzawaensis NRRL Y-17324]ODV79536.1 DUF618-domain-containing protein [Suhomyces tanzawaensis NRRL Y-17324]